MSEKHVAVCDNCGTEGPLTGDNLARFPNRPPDDWFIVGTVSALYSREIEPTHLCSMRCLAAWGRDHEQ